MFAVKARRPTTAKNMKNFFILVFVFIINKVLDSYLFKIVPGGLKTTS
jgi:hypothetical protein